MNVREEYAGRFNRTLQRIAGNLERHLEDHLKSIVRVDRISARAKSIERFVSKSEKSYGAKAKYDDPLNQIQDQIGARIITFYLTDVEKVKSEIERYYRPIESRDLIPESDAEFGYVGKHYILILPPDVIEGDMVKSDVPEFFELQIKTLFQHAWSEANHDLGYKPDGAPLSSDEKRRLAFTAAQAWGADRMFDELFRERSS
ncbi:MAG: RelA/SpoT domain-containing protein [Bosea sp.]|uniref:GTP pyrophosphokinase n=1 Tax=Bosea sp. (in: a-proteobacteria) TaxID=1871050 RepID=UPI001AC96DE8|nr:RelA/SpoT domain-containing protein [Bosea sp. (in: a-proteobacteria)]MBN9452889.1 RelA/SpoT domain-containing protein [Bosea sp. (in: a-proteobacteria)]